jgi:hypothetical protein
VPLPPERGGGAEQCPYPQSGAGARSRPKRDPESYPPLSRVVIVALIPTPGGADDGREHEQHGCGGGKGFVYGLVCGDPSFVPFLVTVRIVCVSPER